MCPYYSTLDQLDLTNGIAEEGEGQSQTHNRDEQDQSLMENKVMEMADLVKYIDQSNVKLEDKFLLEGGGGLGIAHLEQTFQFVAKCHGLWTSCTCTSKQNYFYEHVLNYLRYVLNQCRS